MSHDDGQLVTALSVIFSLPGSTAPARRWRATTKTAADVIDEATIQCPVALHARSISSI
jgi:hypothetical protein